MTKLKLPVVDQRGRGGEHEGPCLPPSPPPPLGEPKITISAEHHLKDAYEQEIGLEMMEKAILEAAVFKLLGEHTPRSSRKLALYACETVGILRTIQLTRYGFKSVTEIQ